MMSEPKKTRVLLVDDEKHVRLLVKAVLLPLNCEIVGEAGNGEEAVELYQQLHPDVVFLDVNMPIKDGREALKDIIAHDDNAKVVMLTSLTDMETVKACVELGAINFIRKDTPVSELRELLKEIWLDL